jgi:hydroxymethylpyrimidine kinase/phosphomethylpyrimidine kinase
MVATSGARLLEADAVESYRMLLRRCTLATPNLDEAAVLLGAPVRTDQLEAEAQRLADTLGCAVLLKGGHLDGDPHDVLAMDDDTRGWTHPRVTGVNAHGTGCMLSSAIAARLARRESLVDACADALAFVHDALVRGRSETVHAQPNVEAAQIVRSHLST